MSSAEHNSAKRRGRPREFEEDQLLERARALFWSQGFAATSLGVARATLDAADLLSFSPLSAS